MITRQVEVWSKSRPSALMPDYAVADLATSFVGQPAGNPAQGPRFASDFADRPAVIAYFSVDSEASAILLRDLWWLHIDFRDSGLEIVAINVDPDIRTAELLADIELRKYPFEYLLDTRGHSRMIARTAPLPIAFLVIDGEVRQRSSGFAPFETRTIWGTNKGRRAVAEALRERNYKPLAISASRSGGAVPAPSN